MTVEAPFCQACENNKRAILALLAEHLADSRRVLEIGSGTGQHAVFFAPALPHLTWITSDLAENHPGILSWMARHPAPNLEPPLALDVTASTWPALQADAAFSANTAHIMSWDAVGHMFRGVAALLPAHGRFALYGPFRYGERHTSEGNRAFHRSLRARDPDMGIRDAHAVEALAAAQGLELLADAAMPANNRTLIWRRT